MFEGLAIWQDEDYRQLQGTYPVIFLSFANIKEKSYDQARRQMCDTIRDLYNQYAFLLESDCLNANEKESFQKISPDMEDYIAAGSLNKLSLYLSKYYGKRVIILLDEYDTPMQEAYVMGYWDEMVTFTRSLFNATFKTNPYMERAIMTGITRVSRESIFSDLNHLEVVTTTSKIYADSFGFTEQEVFDALKEYGLSAHREDVKAWYDGFRFGDVADIYNPWSIINYLDKKELGAYWANSSANSLAGKVIREGNKETKQLFEQLMKGNIIQVNIDEQIVYNQLDRQKNAVWSLLLASGYLKIVNMTGNNAEEYIYALQLTNHEVKMMFKKIIKSWLDDGDDNYNEFIKALLQDDVKAMNIYMNRVALSTFSFFDTGNKASEYSEPERFYHGFVLGLMVELEKRYAMLSNRESGFGRYDVMLEPKNDKDHAIILEFKVRDEEDEATLADTVAAALRQISDKAYAVSLEAKGISSDRIYAYGFAFQGKKVLIGK